MEDLLRLLPQATTDIIGSIKNQRFFKSERAFQGQFLVLATGALSQYLAQDLILEIEHQKIMGVHGTRQRPDLILHTPRGTTSDPKVGNVAFWFFKLNSTREEALRDFRKMDEMVNNLRYPRGFFINIQSEHTFSADYTGNHRDSFSFLACRLNGDQVSVTRA